MQEICGFEFPHSRRKLLFQLKDFPGSNYTAACIALSVWEAEKRLGKHFHGFVATHNNSHCRFIDDGNIDAL